jgi:hypothetical protein
MFEEKMKAQRMPKVAILDWNFGADMRKENRKRKGGVLL